jgi:tetratricopeptide (TPR) repeat protein
MKTGVLVRILLASAVLGVSTATARIATAPILLLAQADRLRVETEHSQAIRLYGQLAQLRPRWAVTHVRLGQIYFAQRRWQEAEREFSLAMRLDEKDARALGGLASVLAHRGITVEAVELWNQALTLDPSDAEARYRLGRAYLDLSALHAAEDQLQRLLLHEIDHQGGHYLLGLLQAPDDAASAVEHLRIASTGDDVMLSERAQQMLDVLADVSSEQDSAQRAGRLAQAYLRIDEPSLAMPHLYRVLALQPDNHTARAYYGYALFAVGEVDLARDTLRQITQIDPKNPLSHYFLGVLHRSDGYAPTALREFKESLHLDPSNAAVYAEIADTHQRLGQYVAAEEWYRAAVSVAPKEPGFRLLLTRFYVDLVLKPEPALAAARETATLLPDDPEAQDLLGWAHYLAGNLSDARRALERALDLDPASARAYYHLGVVCGQLADRATSTWAYQRAIDLDAEGTYRAKALQELGATK